jgi:hypothetical protein
LIGHHVENREDMISGQGKDVFDAFEFERFTNQMTSRDLRHSSSSGSAMIYRAFARFGAPAYCPSDAV